MAVTAVEGIATCELLQAAPTFDSRVDSSSNSSIASAQACGGIHSGSQSSPPGITSLLSDGMFTSFVVEGRCLPMAESRSWRLFPGGLSCFIDQIILMAQTGSRQAPDRPCLMVPRKKTLPSTSLLKGVLTFLLAAYQRASIPPKLAAKG